MTSHDKASMVVLFSITSVLFGLIVTGNEFNTDQHRATMQIPFESTGTLITAIATLVAAFAGAWAAFQLQARQSKEDRAKRDVEAANSTILELLRKRHVFIAVRSQSIKAHRADPGRHVHIMPSTGQ